MAGRHRRRGGAGSTQRRARDLPALRRIAWGSRFHPDSEQLLLRVLGLTLVVAAFAEYVHASAAVGAFLVGLTLTGAVAARARAVLSPLRDLFAAVFFLAIGLSVDVSDLLPVLPVAILLAVATAITKIATGWYAAGREGAGAQGRWRAGTALTARGEFSLVIVGLVGTRHGSLGDMVTAYVVVLAVAGPLLARAPAPRLLVGRRVT